MSTLRTISSGAYTSIARASSVVSASDTGPSGWGLLWAARNRAWRDSAREEHQALAPRLEDRSHQIDEPWVGRSLRRHCHLAL